MKHRPLWLTIPLLAVTLAVILWTRCNAADEQPTSGTGALAPTITVTVKRPTPDDKLRLRDAQLHSQSVFIALLQSPQYVAWQKAAAAEERVTADIEKAAGCKLDMTTAECSMPPKEAATLPATKPAK